MFSEAEIDKTAAQMTDPRNIVKTNILDATVTTFGQPYYKNGFHNPYSGDPDFRRKLVRMLHYPKPTNYTLCSRSDHSGEIAVTHYNGECRWYQTPNTVTRVSSLRIIRPQDEVDLFSGDGILCSRTHLKHDSIVVAVRTCDCIPLAIVGVNYEHRDSMFGAIHISRGNLCNYDQRKDFSGSILKNLFGLIDPKSCYVAMGPAIGGVATDGEPCWHYQYTETTDKKDGTRLLTALKQEYPDIDFEHFVLREIDGEHMGFQWGSLVATLLRSHGVKNLNTDINFCTMCHADTFYSNRHARQTNNADEIEKRYGNITSIAINP